MKKSFVKTLIKTVIILLLCILFLTPFIWMISSSLKGPLEVLGKEFHFFGEEIHWDNYKVVWTDPDVSMLRSFGNTLWVCVISITVQLMVASMAAFAFAKLDFKGKNFYFLLFLSSMMVPVQVTIIPRFIMFKSIGLYNNLWSIILPFFFSASAIFMLRQFYMGLPTALMEAAKIDGASNWCIFSRVYLPLTKPAMVSLTVLGFVSTWNEYLSPLIFITKPDKYLVSQVIRWYMDSGDVTRYDLTMAACTSVIIPVIVLFIACQKYFVEGIATSGVKG